MYKKVLALLVVIAFCLTGLGCGGGSEEQATAQTPAEKIEQSVLVRPNTNEDFRYNVYTYYVEISECLSTKSNIVIPDTIQDLPVYKICKNAFQEQTTFTSLTMTNNIIEIGENAFSGCVNLSSVTLSNNLAVMGSNAFAECENLKEITIPGTLTEIPSGAFSGCSRLLSVKIEKGKTTSVETEDSESTETGARVLNGAFSSCPELRVVWIPEDIGEIASGEFSNSMENLTICGKEESAAAQFAATNLIDFKTEAEFKELSSSALTTQRKGLNETVMSTTWKMGLSGVYCMGSDFKYIINRNDPSSTSGKIISETKTETVNNNENVVFLALTVSNLSGSTQNINILDFEVTVDDYSRRINSYDSVSQISSASQGVVSGAPLNGDVKAASSTVGCIAVRVPSNWDTIVVKYKGDITLESTAFEISRDNTNIKWCTVGQTAIPSNPTVPTTNPTTPSETTTVETTTAVSTTTAAVTTTVPTTEAQPTTSPFSTLPDLNNN